MKTTGMDMILQERKDQIEKHGLTPEHDKEKYGGTDLLLEAANFAMHPGHVKNPFNQEFADKLQQKSRAEQLAVSGALIMAHQELTGDDSFRLHVEVIADAIDALDKLKPEIVLGLDEDRLTTREKVMKALEQMGRHGFVVIAPDDKSPLYGLPENMPLYKDSGLWQLRSDDMETVVLQQDVRELESEFLDRCRVYQAEMIREIMLGMTKAEAIEAMLAGEKVTHEYFNRNEWITMVDGVIVSEDGVKHSDFWKIRTDSAYERGWSKWQES